MESRQAAVLSGEYKRLDVAKGVPCLDLGRLGDSDEEDGDSYIPYTGSSSHRCQLDSSSEWRMSLQTPYAQHQHVCKQKTRPENLPSPTDRSKLKHGQYEAGMKEEYKWHPQRIAEKKNNHLQCPNTSIKGTKLEDGHDDFVTLGKKALLQQCYTNKTYNMQRNIRKSEAEDFAAERRKQAVVEQVMVDQLCRAVINDPEQSTRSNAYKAGQGLPGVGIAPVCVRKRTLHETKIRTKSRLTKNMLSNKLRFDSRIISRNDHDACRELTGFFFACDKSLTVYEFQQFGKNRMNALPFIQKGVYQHQRAKKGKAYDFSDFYMSSVLEEECSRQLLDDSKVFRKIQGIFRETLSKRGVWVITGLGKYFQTDKNSNGFLSQVALKEALKVFHLEMPEGDFESLWLILDDSKSDEVDYGEFTHAIFGEMNEYRKAFVRKAYVKLDFNKTGRPMVDVRKGYCAKKRPLVLTGKTAEEEIKSILEALGASCSNPNEVSYSEFEDYNEELSFGIMGDNDFVNILRNSWGI
ncbi:LOW QUALITY PROTEIN: calcyphosin-2 [Sylvia borin]